jgi:radical SAM protein with 4Fe4S-binding SPASM domain
MRKNLHEWIRYASNKGLYTVTSTNGQMLSGEVPALLVESGLDRIIISIDGTEQETYSKYRKNGNLEAVINGIMALSDARKKTGKGTPAIILQFLVFRHNQHQIPDIKRLGKEWGADGVQIKSAQIEYPDTGINWLPVEKKYTRYIQDSIGGLRLKNNIRNRCRRLWETSVITTDGLVVPCCFDKLPTHPMGSLKDSGFISIWRNQKYRFFRGEVLSNRKKIAICTNCSEGLGKVYIR